MPAWYPKFILYQSNGTTPILTLTIISTNWPYEQPSSVEINSLRSQGAIIIPGGNKAYDLEFRCILVGTDYTDLTDKIFDLKTDIAVNTPYVLKIDKSISTTDNLNVMRTEAIIFDDSRRINIQYYTLRLKANCW